MFTLLLIRWAKAWWHNLKIARLRLVVKLFGGHNTRRGKAREWRFITGMYSNNWRAGANEKTAVAFHRRTALIGFQH